MITALDKNTALVLIDLQQGITSRETAHPAATIISRAAALAAAFRAAQLPVIIVHVNPLGAPASLVRAESQSLPKDPGQIAAAQEQMAQAGFFNIVPELGSAPDDIHIRKTTWNAFHATALHETLQQRGISGIVLAGIATSIGVESTARTANELGYNLSFATDALTDMVASAHEHSLKFIFPRIGELGTTADIIAQLSRRG